MLSVSSSSSSIRLVPRVDLTDAGRFDDTELLNRLVLRVDFTVGLKLLVENIGFEDTDSESSSNRLPTV